MQKLLRFLLLLPYALLAQEDCYLGIGGKDDKRIIEVFQLTEAQTEQLRNWGAELKVRNTYLEDQALALLKNHPQTTTADIVKMGDEFKILLDSMRSNMRMLDQRLLNTFSEEQYSLYIMLCSEILKDPIYANRIVNEK
ncbi:MAG: hypothetical protein AAF634_13590 [Bacteroidota bacterium]